MRERKYALALANPTITAKWGKEKLSKMIPSKVTSLFDASQSSQRLTYILNNITIQIIILIHKIHC